MFTVPGTTCHIQSGKAVLICSTLTTTKDRIWWKLHLQKAVSAWASPLTFHVPILCNQSFSVHSFSKDSNISSQQIQNKGPSQTTQSTLWTNDPGLSASSKGKESDRRVFTPHLQFTAVFGSKQTSQKYPEILSTAQMAECLPMEHRALARVCTHIGQCLRHPDTDTPWHEEFPPHKPELGVLNSCQWN